MEHQPSRVMCVVGARPNMVKMAPLLAEMHHHAELWPVLVHTGQHYDYAMSEVFLEQLKILPPDYNLGVGSGTHHAQTAEIIRRFGELVSRDRPQMVVVVGDVNSTVACGLVAAKECIPLVHVEAGLRSFDRTMPEEINRIVTDGISDLLFATEESAVHNLLREGIADNKIYFVGNLMIDSLAKSIETARNSHLLKKLALPANRYVVLTLHRPGNVDDPDRLSATLKAILEFAERVPVLFPVHPRTHSRIMEAVMNDRNVRTWNGEGAIGLPGLWLMPPIPYLEFVGMVDRSAMVITDSGGIQEETTYLGVPCLTFRESTERPITVTHGTNRVIGTDPAALLAHATEILEGAPRIRGVHPPLWDGMAATRVVPVLTRYLREREEFLNRKRNDGNAGLFKPKLSKPFRADEVVSKPTESAVCGAGISRDI